MLIAPFPGARILYFLLTLGGGILGESAVNSVFNGIKGLFGLGKKLGNLVKGTGEGVKEFKKALEEGKDDDEKKED